MVSFLAKGFICDWPQRGVSGKRQGPRCADCRVVSGWAECEGVGEIREGTGPERRGAARI